MVIKSFLFASYDLGILVAFTITDARFHDRQVAIPLMKMAYEQKDIFMLDE